MSLFLGCPGRSVVAVPTDLPTYLPLLLRKAEEAGWAKHHVLARDLVFHTERSKAWVCGRLIAGIAGSNPAGGMDVCVL